MHCLRKRGKKYPQEYKKAKKTALSPTHTKLALSFSDGDTDIYTNTLFSLDVAFILEGTTACCLASNPTPPSRACLEWGCRARSRGKQTCPGCSEEEGMLWSPSLWPWICCSSWVHQCWFILRLGSHPQGSREAKPWPWNAVFFPGSLVETHTVLHSTGLHGAPLGRQLPASYWRSYFWVSGCTSDYPSSQTASISSPSNPFACHSSRLRRDERSGHTPCRCRLGRNAACMRGSSL